jgi:hypothetical protein
MKSGNYKHGKTGTKEFNIWKSMKQRCYNKKNKSYKNYGGRGIKMCDRWKNSFIEFYKDVGKKPEGLSINRKNNDEGYTPQNCEWSNRKEQNRNSRNCKLSEHKAITIKRLYSEGFLINEIAILYRVSDSMISHIITKRNWRRNENNPSHPTNA